MPVSRNLKEDSCPKPKLCCQTGKALSYVEGVLRISHGQLFLYIIIVGSPQQFSRFVRVRRTVWENPVLEVVEACGWVGQPSASHRGPARNKPRYISVSGTYLQSSQVDDKTGFRWVVAWLNLCSPSRNIRQSEESRLMYLLFQGGRPHSPIS